jgi:hypothetical protein
MFLLQRMGQWLLSLVYILGLAVELQPVILFYAVFLFLADSPGARSFPPQNKAYQSLVSPSCRENHRQLYKSKHAWMDGELREVVG